MSDSRSNEAYRHCTLEVHLLPRTDWCDALHFQRRLVYELGDRPGERAALIITEHPPIITVGRQGSHAHFQIDTEELDSMGIPVKWTNRGGGCWLFGPGIISVNVVFPVLLKACGLAQLRRKLIQVFRATGSELLANSGKRLDAEGLTILGRAYAGIGIAVKNGMTYHGGWINQTLDPDWSGLVRVHPEVRLPLTSLCRETRSLIRPDAVRETLVRAFLAEFAFESWHFAATPDIGGIRRRPIHVPV